MAKVLVLAPEHEAATIRALLADDEVVVACRSSDVAEIALQSIDLVVASARSLRLLPAAVHHAKVLVYGVGAGAIEARAGLTAVEGPVLGRQLRHAVSAALRQQS